jgi:hypothetical protein
MGFLFEFLFEFILELIIIGQFDGATSKKAPMPVRIISAVIFFLIFGGVIGLIAYLGISALIDKRIIAGIIMLLISVLILAMLCYGFRKEYIKKRRK